MIQDGGHKKRQSKMADFKTISLRRQISGQLIQDGGIQIADSRWRIPEQLPQDS
jgi:hypothetical protein